MAFGGLILTNKGREALTKAQLGEALEFTGIAVGDGSYTGSYNDITSLAHELAVLDILRAEADGGVCVLEAELSNAGLTAGYYLREIGILAKNGEDTVLYAYTNAGTDAEYIPAGDGAVSVEKRLRFSLVTDGVSDIIFDAASVMYVAQQDFENHLQADNPHNITADTIGAAKKEEFDAEIEGIKAKTDQFTAAEAGYLSGVTSPIQKQINNPDISEKTVTFAENADSYEIASGENTKTLFGKLLKFINTLKSIAPNFLSSGRAPIADKLNTKRYIDGVAFDGSANIAHYGTCSTAAATAAKTVSITGFSLVTGARVTVLFSNGNTAASPTLNVTSTGAKPIYYRGAAIPTNYIQPGVVLSLVYSGSYWRVEGDRAPTEHASSDTTYGVSTETLYGHAKASTTTPKAPGQAASVGSETASFARGDHVHPAQTDVTGNAGTATKLSTTRYIDGIGFDGSEDAIRYAVCNTAGNVSEKQVTIDNFKLAEGARVLVRFKNANTASSQAKLNVNGTGAFGMYSAYGNSCSVIKIGDYDLYEFVYVPKSDSPSGENAWMTKSSHGEYEAGVIKDDLSTIKTPDVLYAVTTGGIHASDLLTWEYTTVSNLSKWKEVRMWVEVGDAACGYQTFTRDKNTVIVNGYYSVGYNSTMRVLCDFTNNRVGIYVAGLTGWGFTQVRVLRIEGLIKYQ